LSNRTNAERVPASDKKFSGIVVFDEQFDISKRVKLKNRQLKEDLA
jgi:hypothetical protein